MNNKNTASLQPFTARQGDVQIERIAKLPDQLTPVLPESGRVILAHGEVTGHAHAFTEADAKKFTGANGSEFFDVTGRPIRARLPIIRRWKTQVMVQHPQFGIIEFYQDHVEIQDNEVIIDGTFGLLQHDEHHAHGIPAGLYVGGGSDQKVYQREYTPEAPVRVAD